MVKRILKKEHVRRMKRRKTEAGQENRKMKTSFQCVFVIDTEVVTKQMLSLMMMI